jgi:hypothetical protein
MVTIAAEVVFPETGICILCGGPYFVGGCNPEPLASINDGRCCADCDFCKVIPGRIAELRGGDAA